MRSKLIVLTCFRFSFFCTAFAVAGSVQSQVYYRVDSGYSKSTGTDIKDRDSNLFLICGDGSCTTPGTLKDVGRAIIFGGGVGRRFNPSMRGDVMLAYRAYNLNTSDAFGTNFRADVISLSLMFTGYYDFDAASGWSPYTGAGIGMSQNRFTSVSFSNTQPANGFSGSAPGGTKTGVAWMITTGVSYPFPGNLIFDLGLRYIDLGKIETDPGNLSVTQFGSTTTPFYPGASGRLRAQELTIGMRF